MARNTNLQHPTPLMVRLFADHYREILAVHADLLDKKVVVTDLDNTLWKGEIGEGSVQHFADYQQTLKTLRQKGIVLAVNSKNDPRNVRWDGALLNEGDFVNMQINWDSKVANMRRIEEALNLKLQHFVFIDDRADQRALVQDALGEVHVLDATSPRVWKQLAIWAATLSDHPEIDRTRQYQEREQRESFISSAVAEEDPTAMIAKLEIRVDIRGAGASDLKRVTELINRTNQFNLTGSRITANEMTAWHRTPGKQVIVVEAADKFGAMGLICAALVDLTGSEIRIPTFVLSCRVFGYGIEDAVLASIKRLATSDPARGVRPIRGDYRETSHNEPCRQMYSNNGFNWDGGSWILPNPAPSPFPEWLTVADGLSA
jgi:FkbH-like protein